MTTNEELRRLASEATPGPWSRYFGDVYGGEESDHPDDANVLASCQHEADAAYIAAANPDVVKGLLDELEHHPYSDYIAARQAAEETIRELRERITALEAERDGYRTALKEIARLKDESPVGLIARQALSSLSQESKA